MTAKYTIAELRDHAKSCQLNIELTLGIIRKVRELHFKKGKSIPVMRRMLKTKLNRLRWLKNGKPIKGLSNFILIVLGYEDWSSYNQNLNKIKNNKEKNILKNLENGNLEELQKLANHLNLDIEIDLEILEKIKKLHFKQGASIPKIASSLKKELTAARWIQNGVFIVNKYNRKPKPSFKRGIPTFIAYFLGYNDWKSYKKAQQKIYRKIKNKERYDSGFTPSLKDKIKKKFRGKCVICGKETNIDIHHIDGDPTNNKEENLVPVCKIHHKEIGRGYYIYDAKTKSFKEKVLFEISKNSKYVQIRSIYDRTLIRIIKSLYQPYGGRNQPYYYDRSNKVWRVKIESYNKIEKTLTDYIRSTGRKYRIEMIYSEITPLK